MSDDPPLRWTDLTPAGAANVDLTDPRWAGVAAPHNELGQRCPWPWGPQQLGGAPMGQYHCEYCGAMVVAGLPHLDYGPAGGEPT